MDEIELKAYLTERLLSFCRRWNSIENTLYTERTAEEDKLRQELPVAEFHYAKQTDWFALLNEQIAPLFDDFCTDKPRVYGGKVRNSFGFPSKFNGCDHPLEVQITFKNKSRAEIYIKTNTNFEDEYLFIALKKADEWRIDSYKNRRYGNEKWSVQIL
ncbi:Uncharacterised protein [Shewanella putrefaciens]|uniref:NTF2 fold immunity protein n=1 Tax=Shewanella putrefaciens TaxID=24 RepID=UPI000E00B3E3|nr:NTF2 fold immunity protein [Shewanella putrefaciens]SUI60381.1 Uncharacterised protein [Shewanella putrefaciens]